MREIKVLREIEECFRWERVHSTINHLQWKWAAYPSPTVEDVKEFGMHTLQAALKESVGHKQFTYATGGWEITVYRKKSGELRWVCFRFVVEDWSSYA